MFPDSSFYLQQHLLARVSHDYHLDHRELVGRYLAGPVPFGLDVGLGPNTCHDPKGAGLPSPPAVVHDQAPKPRRRVEWDHTKHCAGTKNNGTHCCSVRLEGTQFCRHHQGQKDHPVPLEVGRTTDDDDAPTPAHSFSVHTPAHSRRPSVGDHHGPVDLVAQRVFADLANNRVGCGHLLKKVALVDRGYSGWSLPCGPDFEAEPMFRQVASVAGLAVTVVGGDHLIPLGYIEPGQDSVCSSVEPELALDPVDGDDDSSATSGHRDPVDHVDLELDYDMFMAMAESVGLDDDVDPACTLDDNYFPFGIYVTSVDENIKQFQKMVGDEGYETVVETVDDEDYLFVMRR